MANKPLQSLKFPGLPDTYTVPQVDSSLSVSGKAADAKKVGDELTDVKQDLAELSDGKDLVNYSVILNKGFNKSDGTFPNENGWDITSFIPVTPGEVVHISNTLRSHDYNGFYASDKSYITYFNMPISDDYELVIPNNVYYMVLTNAHASFNYVIWRKPLLITDIENEIAEADSYFRGKDLVDVSAMAFGFVRSSDGSIYNGGSTYKYTELIPVVEGDEYFYYGYGSDGVLIIGAYEEKNGNAIISKSVVGNGSGIKQSYVVPTGIKYIRISSNVNELPIFIYRKLDKYVQGLQGGNFNDFAPSSVPYIVQYGFTYTNAPINDSGILYCYEDFNSSTVWQVFIDNDTKNLYLRRKVNGTWGAWTTPPSQWTPKNRIIGNVDMNDYTNDGLYSTLSGLDETASNFPPAYSSVGLFVVNTDTSTSIVYQTFIESYTGKVFTRIKRSSGWDAWGYSQNEKEISILFVGNSLTQDGIAYLPYLLKTYYPEVNFRFYMWYNGGYTLGEQYADFVNNTACAIFSVCENGTSWTNYNSSKTMAEVLTSYSFDVVCMQEYFNYKTSYTDSDLSDWNNCRDYITSHYTGGNPLEFISLFHAPKRDDATVIFNRTVAGNNLILQKTIAQDMIPNGIAVYRALSTDLDSLGDQGHLSPDGTHTQEGLPCLLQTYVTACWIFDKLGIAKSVYGCPMRMTTTIYNTLNVPGANLGTGVITGTDAQNILAQEVAIKAYKEGKYYVNNNIFAQT